MWEGKARQHHERSAGRKGAVAGRWRAARVVLTFQPGSRGGWQTPPGLWGQSWSWTEGCLDSFVAPPQPQPPGAVSLSWMPRTLT